MDEALRRGLPEIAAALGLKHEMRLVADLPPTAFDASCIDAVRSAARRLGLTTRDITSGAGHDAVYMARVCPAAMIFTPCIGGISHNEAEAIKPEWAENGANVLIEAVLQKAEVITSAG
jgi:N-carbamoyl-L-amino-acid hydrolase